MDFLFLHKMQGVKELLGKETLDTLLGIRSSLEARFSDFPKRCCNAASDRIYRELGFEYDSGLFVDGNDLGNNHAWSMTPAGLYVPHKRLIVDLTADQFDGNFPPILVLVEGSKEAKKHYWSGVAFMY